MKRYFKEDFDPAIYNSSGNISLDDAAVVDSINSNLEVETSCAFITPYVALEKIRKVLAYYKIFLPKGNMLDQNHGNDVFEISQFGEMMGMRDTGEVVTKNNSSLFMYFEWSLNEKGMYDIFASIVDQSDLDEILSDYEAEVEDDETDLQEEHSIGDHTKTLYRIVNASKAAKQNSDINSYVEHEKQGKTFTQMCEESMPNPKKKFSSILANKAVSLSKRMQNEGYESREAERNWKRVKLHGKAGKASAVMMNKGDLKGAKKKLNMMKRLSKKLSEPDKIDEVSREWLDKKASRGFDLARAYTWKDNYKRADKKYNQIKMIGKYIQKKGMKKPPESPKEEPDELQKRYDELKYKGD